MTEKRLPVGVSTGGHVRQELAYGNHRRVQNYEGEVPRKAISDAVMSQALIFEVEETQRIDGLRILLVEVVEEKSKYALSTI